MKRFLLSMLAIFLVIGLAGSGAFAWFSDTETSTGNTFIAGTFDLKVSDWDEGPKDGVSYTWTMSDMQPGITTVGPFDVVLQNSGSIAANHVEISFSHSINDLPDVESDTNKNSTPGEMARWIEITSCTYTGVNLSATLTNANGNGFLDLEDVTLPANAAALDNLPPPLPNNGGSRTFSMALKFNSGATNDIQGDTLTTTVTFTLNQSSSQ